MDNKPTLTRYPNGTKLWHLSNKYHNLDGPAAEYSDGHKEYWIDDVRYSFEEWDRRRKLILFK